MSAVANTRRGFLARLGALGVAAALPRPALGAATAAAAAGTTAAEHDGRLRALLAALAAARPGLPAAPAGPDDERGWRALRAHFVLPAGDAFFNAGTLGASPRVVLDAMLAHQLHVERDLAEWDYDPAHEQFYAGYYPERELRAKIGRLVNADADEIALTGNATTGMNLVANGLDLGVGDEVVLAAGSHVGSRSGWELRDKRCGLYLKVVTPPARPAHPDELVAMFERATSARTRVWAIEHLTSATGVRYPVEALCRLARDRGILTVVDGAQTAGHLAVDVRAMGCDAYFTSPHKWLLAPPGTGFLYVRRDVQPRLWSTIASQHWDDQADGGFRLMQQGTASRSVLEGVSAALDFHFALGSALVERRAIALAERLRLGLAAVPGATVTSPAHPAMRTGTTLWQVDGLTGRELQDRLWAAARVRVRSQGAAVRQCCHVFNLAEEVDRTVEAARRL
jgi:selenocysteine lyase/cysteine desulfurase